MSKEKQTKPGTRFFILCRNEDGNPTEICQYIFLAQVANAAIVAPVVLDLNDPYCIEEILDYWIQDTAEIGFASLLVFPLADCFVSQEEAENVFAEYKRSKKWPFPLDGKLFVYPIENLFLDNN